MSAGAGNTGSQSLQSLVDANRREDGAPPDRHHHISGHTAAQPQPPVNVQSPDRDAIWKDR